MSRVHFVVIVILALGALGACDLVDPMRPTPQPDSETFGNLLETEPDPSNPGVWTAKIRVGVPRALGRTDDPRPTPDVAGGILALVAVTADTVVIVDDRPAALEDIGPGTEVVVIPVPGTTTIYGEAELHMEGAQLMDFATYARWRMPKLDLGGATAPPVEDPAAINTSGVENGPIPIASGRVLYFTARLRPPELPNGDWLGARRDGLATPAEGERSFERSYRTELGEDGWSAPELVVFPGIEMDQHVKLTWVSGDELVCYVTVTDAAGRPWVATSRRTAKTDPWGDLERMEAVGTGDAFDAVAMVGATEKTLFATTRTGGGDLYLHDPAIGPAQPLQPEINSGGLEWAPRVGPASELYFVRGDRQLLFRDGRVHEVRLPAPHRVVFTEAAPSGDGAWLFFALPRYRPVELDFDIAVAAIGADGALGPAVPVDDWRPY